MSIDNAVIGKASELMEFIFAARECLEGLDYKPDVRLENAVNALNNCPNERLEIYGTILQQLFEKRSDSTMMRIYGLYRQTFQERITPF
jgi:hypothetical protein